MLVIILDNRSTSMTGFQDNPGTGIKITKEPGNRVILEDLVRGCGISPENLWIEDPYNLKRIIKKLKEAVSASGVKVLISRHICSILEINKLRAQNQKPPEVKIESSRCTGCLTCINQFGCPAISFNNEDKKAFINQDECRGCKVCIAICNNNAIIEVH